METKIEPGTYRKEFDRLFAQAIEDDCVAPRSKLEYIGDHIFDFTTYDSAMDEYLAAKMIEVLESIHTRTTFDYHGKNEENYINYITMVNMPFLADKLSWGGSIRGAWFEGGNGEYKIGLEMTIPKDDFELFIGELIEWSRLPSPLINN